MSKKEDLIPALIEIVADYSRNGNLITDVWAGMVREDQHAVNEVGMDFMQILLWAEAQEYLGSAGPEVQAEIEKFASAPEAESLVGLLRDNQMHPVSALFLGFVINLKFTSSYGCYPYDRLVKAIRKALED